MLHNNNFENDFNITITNTKIETDQLYNRYIYSDIDNGRQNPTLKLLSAIDNIKLVTTAASDIVVLIITYHSKGYFILLNDQKNSSYFLAIFSI